MKKATVGLALLLALSMMLLAACGGQTIDGSGAAAPPAPAAQAPAGESGSEATGTTEGDAYKVGFVTASGGGVGDESLTDMVYYDLVASVEKIGGELQYVEPKTTADMTPMFRDFCQDGSYDVIVGIGYDCVEAVSEMAELYPEQKFIAVDAEVLDRDNVVNIVFNRAEQGYVVGLAVGYFTQLDSITLNGEEVPVDNSAKTVGVVLGDEATTIVESQIGMAAACKYFDPEIEFLTGVVGNWDDSAKANEIALNMYAQGASFVWQNAGIGGKGVFSAAADMDGYSEGWNTPQHNMDPDHILFSVVKSMGVVTGKLVEDLASGAEFVSGTQSYGFATDGFTLEYSPNFEPPQEMVDAVNAGLELLKNGEIVVPLTWEELDAFDVRYEA